MMEGYKAGTFKGDGNTLFLFAMGIFGLSIMGNMVMNATMRLPSASKKAQGVQCLANCVYWCLFLLSDGYLALSGSMPKAFSGDALPQIYGNLCIFAALAAVQFMGWKSAGSPVPDTSSIVPSGALKTPLIANFINLGFFGIGCKFFTAPFMDMYIPGVVAGINKASPDAMEAIYLIMGNAGMCMCMNIATALMVCAAEPGNADTNYRIQRAFIYTNMLYLGMLSRENVVAAATGWPQPMYLTTVVQSFAVCFFSASALGAYPIKVTKSA
jgi:hypothetical protein